MSRPRFEVYPSDDLDWRWRLKAANGEILASGEGFSSKAHAVRGAKTVVESAGVAELRVLDEELEGGSTDGGS